MGRTRRLGRESGGRLAYGVARSGPVSRRISHVRWTRSEFAFGDGARQQRIRVPCVALADEPQRGSLLVDVAEDRADRGLLLAYPLARTQAVEADGLVEIGRDGLEDLIYRLRVEPADRGVVALDDSS